MDIMIDLLSKRDRIEFTDPRCINPTLCTGLQEVKVLGKEAFTIDLRFKSERLVIAYADEEIGRKNLEHILGCYGEGILDLTGRGTAMLFSEFDRMTAKIKENNDRYAGQEFEYFVGLNKWHFA